MDDIRALFMREDGESKRIKSKKQNILLKYPLFTRIYQQKGQQNFNQIVEKIRFKQYDFGFNIYQEGYQRKFNYIIQGTVMVFLEKEENGPPILFDRFRANSFFGEKTSYKNLKLHSVKSVGKTSVFQLDLETFYKTFSGYFRYTQLNDKIIFLKEIWAFKDLKRKDLERILLTSKTIKYSRNYLIFKPNQIPQSAYVVINGELTLYRISKQAHKKYKPLVILGEKQICGFEEIKTNSNFEYGGICTTQYTTILVISRKLIEEIFHEQIDDSIYRKKQKIKLSITSSQKTSSIENLVKEINKSQKVAQNEVKKRYKSQQKQVQTPFIVGNEKITKFNMLKDRLLRTYTLEKIRQNEREIQHNLGLSIYSNSGFTNDKELLLSYLVRKEKSEKKAISNQLSFQDQKFNPTPELFVQKSSAVKNHKRKLKKSRKTTHSVPSIKTQ